MNYEDQSYPYELYVNTNRRLYNITQGNLVNTNYYNVFTNNVKAIKNHGSEIGNDPTLLKLEEEWEDIDIHWQVATINDVRTVYTIT